MRKVGFSLYNLSKSFSFWWIAGLAWALVEAFAHRHSMNPDGMNYMDMASTGELVNPVWSPLYPALIRVVFGILKPSPELEVPVVHLLNFLIFAATLLCFTFFIRTWIATAPDEKRNRHAVPMGFAVFLWIAIEMIGMASVSPDMCVAAVVFLLAGIGCRLSASGNSWMRYAVLGMVLGLGYYAKAAMFPLGLILLGVLFLWPPAGRRWIAGLLLAGVIFMAVASPLVILMSRRVGHFSFGEAGKLNYLWHVNGLEHFSGWTGEAGKHTPRVLFEKPRVLEFATPVSGTYPLWFDPAYWYEGAKVRIDIPGQIRAALTNLEEILFAFLKMGALAAGALILSILASRNREHRVADGNLRWIAAWSIAALATFVVVHVEVRYIAPFLILLWIVSYDFLFRKVDVGAFAVLGTAFCALYITSVTSFGIDAKSIIHPKPPAYLIVAKALQEAGVTPGDRIASVGYTFDAYYARAARVQVAAEVVGTDDFWRIGIPEMAVLKARLESIGVKAVVVKDRPPSSGSMGGNWKDVTVPGGRYSILLLTD